MALRAVHREVPFSAMDPLEIAGEVGVEMEPSFLIRVSQKLAIMLVGLVLVGLAFLLANVVLAKQQITNLTTILASITEQVESIDGRVDVVEYLGSPATRSRFEALERRIERLEDEARAPR